MNHKQESNTSDVKLWSLERLMRRGAITVEQRERLEAILREDPPTRRFYLDYLESHFEHSRRAAEAAKAAQAEEGDPDFWSLLEMQFDGRLTPEQQQRFDAIMHNDPSARRFFQAYTGDPSGQAMTADQELWSLVESQVESGLDTQQAGRLEQLLEASAENRRFYLAYLDQQASLSWSLRGRQG